MMTKIDWSKPIELHSPYEIKPAADAEVIASDLKGGYPYVVRWTVPDFPSTERVAMCSADGAVLWQGFHVRNKPVVRRQYLAVGVRSGGCVYSRSFSTKEDAEKFLMKDVVEPKHTYVTTQVVELEWTEE